LIVYEEEFYTTLFHYYIVARETRMDGLKVKLGVVFNGLF